MGMPMSTALSDARQPRPPTARCTSSVVSTSDSAPAAAKPISRYGAIWAVTDQVSRKTIKGEGMRPSLAPAGQLSSQTDLARTTQRSSCHADRRRESAAGAVGLGAKRVRQALFHSAVFVLRPVTWQGGQSMGRAKENR